LYKKKQKKKLINLYNITFDPDLEELASDKIKKPSERQCYRFFDIHAAIAIINQDNKNYGKKSNVWKKYKNLSMHIFALHRF